MCAMPQSALEGMTSDPRTGVVAQTRNVYIVMEKEDFSDTKSVLIRKLNLNINKYYPDAGGILMGYKGVKIKRSTFEVNTTTLLHPIHIRASFYLFKPTVGEELMCVVTHREVGRVKCRAHGVFQVEVFNPPGCEDIVFVGQSLLVKVEAVEQMSWQEPKIVGSLVEMIGDNVTPCIDIVENLDATDDETENVTDSGMFENATLSRGATGNIIRQVEEEVVGRGSEELMVFFSSQVPGNTDISDADVKQDCKKRKIEEISSPDGKVSSPVKKRNKKASKSPISTSETSLAALTNEKQSPDTSQIRTSVMPNIQPKPLASSQLKGINVPPENMSSNKSLSNISPEPVPSQYESESDSSSEEEINESPKVDFTSNSSNPKDDEITKTAPECNMSTSISGTAEPNLFEIQVRTTAAPNTYKSPEATKPTTVPKTPKSNCLVPPGFKMTTGSKKKAKPILTAPDGITVFRTYKGAWQWVEDHPNYPINSEPQLATESLASLCKSVSTFPRVFDSHPEPPVETAPVLNGGDSFTCVAPQPSAKQPKLRKKFVPTLVANRREENKANQQRLLIDQPSFSESKLESKSDTEYQSQSLLLPLATITKKKLTIDVHASSGKKTATLVRKSPRAKLAGKSALDNEEDNGAESSFEPIKQINSLASAKPVTIHTTSTSLDASRIASDSEDISLEEDPMTPNKSVVEAAVKSAIPATSVDDSSSIRSGSDNDEDTVISPMAATGSSETVVKMADTSSSDSDSDASEKSSEKSKLPVKKMDQVSVIDLIKSSCAAKGYSLSLNEKSEKSNQVETKSSSSIESLKEKSLKSKQVEPRSSSSSASDSASCNQQPQVQPKKKNSPKSKLKTNLNISEESLKDNSIVSEKSPYLSSTVMTGASKVKDREIVPTGISPIMKTKHKHKKSKLAKSPGISYLDPVISQKSDSKPRELDSRARDNKRMKLKKKGKREAGLL